MNWSWDRRQVLKRWDELLHPHLGACLPFCSRTRCLFCDCQQMGDRWELTYMHGSDRCSAEVCKRCVDLLNGVMHYR